MCGLCGGLSAYLSNAEIEVIRSLMVVSSLRGRHGSGIFTVPHNNKQKVMMVWSPDSSSEFAYSDLFDKHIARKNSIIAAHSRHPTTQPKEGRGEHPFNFNHIVGMHNGTMDIVNGVKIKKGDHDSQLLFQSIAEHGVEETIKNSKGSYALVWVDTQAQTMNFLRNDARPLYFVYDEHIQGTAFWASEPQLLYAIARREWTDAKEPKIIALPTDTMWTFKMRPSGRVSVETSKKIEAGKFEETRTSVPVVAPVAGNSDGVPNLVATQKNVFLMKDEFLRVLNKEGCASCKERGTFEEHQKGELTWIKRNEFICENCMKNDTTAQEYAAMCLNGTVGVH